jgi:hypothetical protein
MQNWDALLRRIPPDQQNSLAMVTSIGIEINVQDILRIEADHVVIRGRQAGTIATGRVFFIPYPQISFLLFQKEMKEPQIRFLYGDPAAAENGLETSIPDPAATAMEAPETKPEPAPPPPEEVKQPVEPPRPGQLKIPRKSGLIERLRARAQAGTNPKPPSV